MNGVFELAEGIELIILPTAELATTAVIETLNESDQFSDIDLENAVINEKILIIISTT